MLHLRIMGANRVCGKTQGFIGLHVRDQKVISEATGQLGNMMQTAWEPTPDELKRLADGAPVIVSVLGTVPQPIRLDVPGDAPKEDA